MVTHWESSTRPLFVKTVWRDGQHHVVLQKDEESVTKRNINSSCHNSARSVRSAKITSSNNKKVSASLKLVLAGVGTFSSTEHKLIRCKSSLKSFDTVPHLTSPRETSLGNRNGISNTSSEYKTDRNINLCIKSNSIDVNIQREKYDKIGTVSPYFSYNNYVESCNNSLSERVMVWLDLAVQNGNYAKDVKIQPQRIVTTCDTSQKRQQTLTKRKSVNNFKLNRSCDRIERIFHVEGTSQILQSANSSVLNTSPLDEENLVLKENNVTAKYQLCSEVEENIVVKDLEQTMPHKNNLVKRQLHIFMPNLPNKYSDCDSSILSSKISTSSLQRSLKKSKNNF